MSGWKNLNAVLRRFVEEGTVLGCGMQIFRDGELIYHTCEGSARADRSRPMEEHTRLRMHSMSKNITCAGIMTLYDQGLFSLDDPVAEYLPEFSNPRVYVPEAAVDEVVPMESRTTVPARSPITIRDLLTMRSGIPYWTFPGMPDEEPVQKDYLDTVTRIAEEVRNGKENTLEAFVKVIAGKPLCFHPGEHWMYGLSLSVIGRLIEVLSGMSLSEYLRRVIWEPLGMHDTCFVQQVADTDQLADVMVLTELGDLASVRMEDRFVPDGRTDVFGSRVDVLPGTDLGIELPCGGMVSSLHDLGRLFSMFANGGSLDGNRILGNHTIDLMRANQLNDAQLAEFAQMTNRGFGYGLGYRTMLNPSAAGFYMPAGSFGWDGASGCYGLASPEHHLAIVFTESSLPHHIEYTIPRVVAAMNRDMDEV